MERTNKGNELRNERNADVVTDVGALAVRDVRLLADLELMLVGGGGDTPDWGG